MSDLPLFDAAKGWLERARSDLNLGHAALNTQGVLPEDACYHAQQCAEKALKGLLTERGIAFPRTHVNLGRRIDFSLKPPNGKASA